jgi:hypothetical protein
MCWLDLTVSACGGASRAQIIISLAVAKRRRRNCFRGMKKQSPSLHARLYAASQHAMPTLHSLRARYPLSVPPVCTFCAQSCVAHCQRLCNGPRGPLLHIVMLADGLKARTHSLKHLPTLSDLMLGSVALRVAKFTQILPDWSTERPLARTITHTAPLLRRHCRRPPYASSTSCPTRAAQSWKP